MLDCPRTKKIKPTAYLLCGTYKHNVMYTSNIIISLCDPQSTSLIDR